MKRMKIAIVSLTGCEGCCVAVLDAPMRFLALQKKIDVVNFRLFEERDHEFDLYDITFVEGSPLTDSDITHLKQLRERSRVVVALGSCADMGGIYHLKSYQDKKKIHNYVYNGVSGVENYDVKSLSEYVKIDFTVPGCPVNAAELFRFIYGLCIGKDPQVKQNPVCYECQARGFECVLQKGEICLGPITQGGCGAVCLKSRQGCWGCRGLVEDAEIGNLVKQLREKHSDREIVKTMEVFGIKERIKV